MKNSFRDRSFTRFSPGQLWLSSQLMFWVPTILALILDIKGMARVGISWHVEPFGVPTALATVVIMSWLLSIVLLLLSSVDFFHRCSSFGGQIAALGMPVVTGVATCLAFLIVMVLFHPSALTC